MTQKQLRKFLKPGCTCENCKKYGKHNLDFEFTTDVRQSEKGTELLAVNVVGDVACRNCGHKTRVSGRLAKFANDLAGFPVGDSGRTALFDLVDELSLALQVASIKNDNAAWSDQSDFQKKIDELLLKAGRDPKKKKWLEDETA